MAANCYSIVRGKRVRVTRLNACGVYPVPTTANSLVTSSGFVSVQYSLDYEEGDEHIQKNANGDLCINDKSCDQFKRVMVTMSFCEVDPDLFSLVTGNTVEVDGSGVDVGFRVSEGVTCSNFAFELWSGLDDEDCPSSNEIQQIAEGGAGLTSFTLTVTVPGYSAGTTASISEAATAAQVQAALEGLDGIDPGDVSVVESVNDPFVFLITFIGRYAGLNITQMTTTPTGGTGTVTATTVQAGGVSTSEYGYFLLPFVKNGTLRDFTVENGPTTFEIQGWTDASTGWGAGPYNVVASGAAGAPSALEDVLTANDHMVVRTTFVAPPAAVCGYQVMPAAPTPAL